LSSSSMYGSVFLFGHLILKANALTGYYKRQQQQRPTTANNNNHTTTKPQQ
jgi:hypothetical protein